MAPTPEELEARERLIDILAEAVIQWIAMERNTNDTDDD